VGEPPGSIGLTPGPGRVTRSWPDPGYSPGYISSIKVEARPGTQSCTSAIDGGGCTVTGLENGTAYTFAVYAIGLTGFTYEPVIVGPVWPCCSVPAAPARVAAEAQQGAAVVSWEPPTNAQAAGNTFTYTVGTTPAGGTCTTTERSCRITGLDDGTGYSFQVTATNGLGTGPAATSTEVTPIGPPGAPTGVQVFLGDKGTATVSWVGPAKTGGAIVDRYVATASPGGASCETTGTLSCTVSGLSNGERYRFAVTAATQAGVGPASAASGVARPLAGPGKATGVKARLSGGKAVVSWVPPRSTGGLAIRDYVVRSSPAGATCRTTGTTCTIGSLRGGTRYVFTVQARNAKGLGLVAQSSALTTPAPATPTATPVQPKPEQVLS
jgi:Fibronectin type III domain